MKSTITVVCPVCDGIRVRLDEDKIPRVCGHCLGQGHIDIQPELEFEYDVFRRDPASEPMDDNRSSSTVSGSAGVPEGG